MSKAFQLGVPAAAECVAAKAFSIIDVDLSAPARHAQVGFVLYKVMEAVEPLISPHVTGEAEAGFYPRPAAG